MKFIDLKEFVDFGYLQELNRKYLHPLGLALVVESGERGERTLHVWDGRDDLEGINFAPGSISEIKAANIRLEEVSRWPARQTALGYWIQPEK